MNYSFEPITSLEPSAPRSAAVPARDGEVRPPELPEFDLSAVVRRDSSPPRETDMAARVAQAREEGRRAGFDEGRRSTEGRVVAALGAVRSLTARLEEAEGQRREESVERIAVLATAIAGHLVEREIRTSPDVLADVVRRAVAAFSVNDALTVRLNPSDLALLSSSTPNDAGQWQLTSGQSVRWIADPAVGPGGCFIESAERVVDGRLSRTLERICHALIHD